MEVIKLLEYLQEIIKTSHGMPMSRKVMISKKEVMDVIEQIINYLPEEFAEAQWICNEKERILKEARKEAEKIKTEGYYLLKQEIERHSVTKEAQIKAEEIISSANRDAKLMRIGAKEYADEILSELEKEINLKGEQMILTINHKTEEYLKSVQSNINTISNTIRQNVKELRSTVK